MVSEPYQVSREKNVNAIELGAKVVEAIIPPQDAAASTQFWWRLRVAAVACGGFFLALGLGLTAYGANPVLPAFATKSDLKEYATAKNVEELASAVSQIQKTQRYQLDEALQRDIRDLRLKYCGAKDGLREEYYNQLQDDLVKYQHRNEGQMYPIQPCPG